MYNPYQTMRSLCSGNFEAGTRKKESQKEGRQVSETKNLLRELGRVRGIDEEL
jgi:hypothetical protein